MTDNTLPNDGRPYSADEFMCRLMDQWEKGELSGEEAMYAVKEWVHGDWDNATYGLSEVDPWK